MTLTRERDRERKRLLRQDPMFRALENERYHTDEYRAASRERARRNYVPHPRVKKPRIARAVRSAAERSEQGRRAAVARWAARAAAPRNPVPAEIRSLWTRADPNSSIRRLYPTMAHLVRGWPAT